MAIPYQAPSYEIDAFNCPHCHAYANMSWAGARADWNRGVGATGVDPVDFAYCNRCKCWSVWYEDKMIFPEVIGVEDPNEDLPKDVKSDYLEAASILQKSPRGAAALLRLSIQKLCNNLVKGPGDLNVKIGELVARGLDKKIQQALDVVRVTGNEAVHPGEINIKDNPGIANQLFKLVNVIAQRMITEPEEVEKIYKSLPTNKLKQVEKRDKKT